MTTISLASGKSRCHPILNSLGLFGFSIITKYWPYERGNMTFMLSCLESYDWIGSLYRRQSSLLKRS